MRSAPITTVVKHRRERSLRSRRSPAQRSARIALGFGAVFTTFLAIGLILLGLGYADLARDLPSLEAIPALFDMEHGRLGQPTRIFDRSGEHVLLTLENPGIARAYVPSEPTQPNHLPDSLMRATVGELDPYFWSHSGYSLAGLGAGIHPTLAQTLAADLLLADESAGLRRDLRERLLAAQLTYHYGRKQVLEWYLNSAYYGHLAFGAEAAAQAYFGKPVGQLDLAESALLVAVSEAPALNPLDVPQAAIQLRNMVVQRLQANGAITAAEAEQALGEKLAFRKPAAEAENPSAAFARLALQQIEGAYGRGRLERGGYWIITTLDSDLQEELVCTIRTQLLRLQGNPSEVKLSDGSACPAALLLPTLPPEARDLPPNLSAGAEILDPQSGQILALVGGTGAMPGAAGADYLSGHAPGSLLTPFIYLAGFTRGISPANLAWDIPASLPVGFEGLENLDGRYHGPLRLRTALANDYWAPAAQLLAQIGAGNVWRPAAQFGLLSVEQAGAAFPFQGGAVTLTEAAQAFGVFANQGVLAGRRWEGLPGDLRSAAVLRVETVDGSPAKDWSGSETQAVISAPLAYLVNSVLSDETSRWPSLGYPNALEIGRPAGAKLGRTRGADAWTVGYTPQRVVAVWLGAAGATDWQGSLDPLLPAGLWHALIQWSTRDVAPAAWNPPAGVTTMEVCDPSGMLPTKECPATVSEAFLTGDEPTHADTLYRTIQVNRETGQLATVFTPPELIEDRVFFMPPAEAQDWARQAGLAVAPTTYDAIQARVVSKDAAIARPALFADVRGTVSLQGTAGGEGFSYYRVQVGQGLNPQGWIRVGPDRKEVVEDGELASWDTQGLEGLYAVRLMVVREDQRVETDTIQVTVDNQPPQARIAYPENGTQYNYPSEAVLTFQAEASDTVGVARVEWLVDGAPVETPGETDLSLSYQAKAPGRHTVQVRVFDRAGNVGESSVVEFRMDEGEP